MCLDGAAVPDAAALPEELRPLVASEGAVLRHGEFLRDADHLADSLAAFVRPVGRGHAPLPVGGARPGRLAAVLVGGRWSAARRRGRRWPSRRSPIALVWALTVAGAWWQGQQGQADDFTQLQVTDNAVKATAGFLNGTVTDEVDRIVEDAVVTLSNLDAQRNTETTTDSAGEFTIPYEAVGATSQVAARAGRHQAPLHRKYPRELRRQRPPLSAEPPARNRGGACAVAAGGT